MYKQYRDADVLTNWTKLAGMTREEVDALWQEWQQIAKDNREDQRVAGEERAKKIDAIAASLFQQGIKVRDHRGEYYAWFLKNVAGQLRPAPFAPMMPACHYGEQVIDGITVSNNCSPMYPVELWVKVQGQLTAGRQARERHNKALAAAYKYAFEHDDDVSGLGPDEVIRTITGLAKERYAFENDADSCYVEGNLLDGFYTWNGDDDDAD